MSATMLPARGVVILGMLACLVACASVGSASRWKGDAFGLRVSVVLDQPEWPDQPAWLVRVPRREADGRLSYTHQSGPTVFDEFFWVAVREQAPRRDIVASLNVRDGVPRVCVPHHHGHMCGSDENDADCFARYFAQCTDVAPR